jgi:transposase-like protein
VKHGRFRNKNRRVQRYRCARCGQTFSEDQPLGDLRVDNKKIIQIVKLLVEGMGVRGVARFTDCQHKTVLVVLNAVGQKCAEFHDKTVRNLTVGALQVDELWQYVGCKQKNAGKRDKEEADCLVCYRQAQLPQYGGIRKGFRQPDRWPGPSHE